MDVVQIGVIGVAGTLLAVQFKTGKTEYGIYISVALSLLIFFFILGKLEVMIDTVRMIGSYISVDRSEEHTSELQSP